MFLHLCPPSKSCWQLLLLSDLLTLQSQFLRRTKWTIGCTPENFWFSTSLCGCSGQNTYWHSPDALILAVTQNQYSNPSNFPGLTSFSGIVLASIYVYMGIHNCLLLLILAQPYPLKSILTLASGLLLWPWPLFSLDSWHQLILPLLNIFSHQVCTAHCCTFFLYPAQNKHLPRLSSSDAA